MTATNKGKTEMKATFWDVKARKKIETEVIDCVTYPNGRTAFKGQTKDGRSLTLFCSKDDAAKFKGGCCKGKCKK